MADLKLGTTLGGAGIWSASNLQLLPVGGQLTYKGWRVYTENDRPTAEDINALSLINGGTVAKNTTFSQNVTVGVQLTANAIQANTTVTVTRNGATPGMVFRRPDLASPPTVESGLMDITAYNGASQLSGAININAKTDGSNKMYLRGYNNGSQTVLFTMDSATQQVTVESGTFRALGNTILNTATITTLGVTGALTANTITPTNWSNHDVRYMSGIPQNQPAVTSFGTAAITEKNDVYSMSGNLTDGPYGNTTYIGQLLNYRRTTNTGNALTQFYLDNGVFHIRSGSGSPGAWSWSGGGANGWRKVYDENNKPTSSEINAVSRGGDYMTGALLMAADISMRNLTSRNIRFEYTKTDGTIAVDGTIYKDGVDNVSRRGGVRISCGTPDKTNGTIVNSGDFVFSEDGSFILPSGGLINQDGLGANVYGTSSLSASPSGSKSYLRKFRGGFGDTVWHETVQEGIYRLATGGTDDNDIMSLSSALGMRLSGNGTNTSIYLDSVSNSTIWYRNNDGSVEKAATWADTSGIYHIRTNQITPTTWDLGSGMIWSKGVTTGTDRGLIRGTVDGGSYTEWTSRSAGLMLDVPAINNFAYSIWKVTKWGTSHVAAMDIHRPGDVDVNARVRIIMNSGAYFYFNGSGEFTSSGVVSASNFVNRSDKRLKSNFRPIERAIDKVAMLKGYVYDKAEYIGGEPTTVDAGILAQDLQKVLPEAVSVGKDVKDNDILMVSSSATIALLVNAINELSEEVRELKFRQ